MGTLDLASLTQLVERGMRERAAALGGDVTAGPAERGGWQVHARLPLKPAKR
jgi:signal transduction histidine kinase